MRREKKVAKVLCISAIVLAFVVVIMGLLLFNQWLAGRNGGIEIGKSNIPVVNVKDLYYDNYWSKSIVTNIVDENVPVPEGTEYVQGTKDTGVIIKNTNTGKLMMWIPYDETVTNDSVKEYYQNCEYIDMDIDTKESIEKYGGFYVGLEENNQYEILKSVDNASYQNAYEQASRLSEGSESLESHLLYRGELAQVLAYCNKIGTNTIRVGHDAGKETKVQKLATEQTTSQATTMDISKIYYASIEGNKIKNFSSKHEGPFVITDGTNSVTVPDGFEHDVMEEKIAGPVGTTYKYGAGADNNKVIKIRSKKNKNLRYVWVEVSKDGMKQAFKELKNYYDKLDTTFWHEDAKDPTNSEEYKALLESVVYYGGFYIGEAELTYDKNGAVVNVAKGMQVTEDGYAGEYWGEYLRGSKVQTYENAKEIASNMHKENSDVVSHLMYGAEWDATMLWLLSKNTVTAEQLIQNSQEVAGAKYQNSYDDKSALLEDDIKVLNGIYGLAGNLVEVTQETATDDNGTAVHVARGGSYLYTGEHYSMASRMLLSDEWIPKGEDIGFRNCLYLDRASIESKQYLEVTDKGEVSVKKEYKQGGKKEKELPKELIIPSQINGITVTSIAESGFEDCQKLEKVTLPETITNIKEFGFYYCKKLKEINLPDGITGIASYAFEKCESLEKIRIPSSCETIYSNAFKNCKGLKEIEFTGTVKKTIEKEAFYGCNNVTTITFKATPNEIIIKEKVFEKPKKIKTLNVPTDMPDEMVNEIIRKLGLDEPSVNTIEPERGEVNYLSNKTYSGLYIENGKVVAPNDNVRIRIPTEKGLYGVTKGWGSYLQLTNLETNERIEFTDSNGNKVSYESIDQVYNIHNKLYGIAFLTNQYDGTVTIEGAEGQGRDFSTTGILFQSNLDGTDFKVIGDKVYMGIQYINRDGKELLFVNEIQISDYGTSWMSNIIWIFDITDPNHITSAKKEIWDNQNKEILIDKYAIAKNEMLIYTHGNGRNDQLMNITLDNNFFEVKDQKLVGGTKVKDENDNYYAPTIIVDYETNHFYVKESKSATEDMFYEVFDTKEYWPLMDEYHNVGKWNIFQGKDGGVEVWVQDKDSRQVKKIYSTTTGKVKWDQSNIQTSTTTNTNTNTNTTTPPTNLNDKEAIVKWETDCINGYTTTDPMFNPSLSEEDFNEYRAGQQRLKEQAIEQVKQVNTYAEAEEIRLNYEFMAERLMLEWKILDYAPNGWENFEESFNKYKDAYLKAVQSCNNRNQIEEAARYQSLFEDLVNQYIEWGNFPEYPNPKLGK